MTTDPDWGDFKVLLALARGGSVAGAARLLEVDNSTVSRRLSSLEDAVGAKLIIRGGREFNWTAEGRTLLTAAEQMETAVVNAVRCVRAAKVEVGGEVRVSVAPAFVPMLIRGVLPSIRQSHPSISVTLSGDYQRVNLAKGEADVAVRMARPDEVDLVVRRAFECCWFVYASEDYLKAHGLLTSFDALKEHRLVLYNEAMHHIEPLRWMESYRVTGQQVTRVDNLEIACKTIAADGGIAVLPCFIADAVPGLQRVFAEHIGLNVGWIVYHESARDTARVRIVVNALLEHFEKNAAVYSGVATSQGTN